MKEEQFNNLFLGPLYNKKFPLNEIDKNTYHEIINLSNKFCMPSQVLNNLVYEPKIHNPLIYGLRKQVHISNLKKLINQRELLKISKIFGKNEINYVFLKGVAINNYCKEYVRYSRDLDILVSKKSLTKAYELLKDIGYRYHDPLVSDRSDFISQSYHLPILSNKEGGLVEVHHRVTKNYIYNECPLAESMLEQNFSIRKNGINIKISNINHLIAHILYHAALHHKFDIGPVFLYDIKYLKTKITNNTDLERLLNQMNLIKVFEEIKSYTEKSMLKDKFKIYETINTKILNQKNPKKLKYFFFSKKGLSDFLKIISRKFKYNEDLFQTSKFSYKFYLILFVQLKNYIKKISNA